jgi:hypothetical protein
VILQWFPILFGFTSAVLGFMASRKHRATSPPVSSETVEEKNKASVEEVEA